MKRRNHIIVIDRPMDWDGLWHELKPLVTYIIGIATGIIVTLSSQS
jgi:hypothetical protein